MFHPTVLPINTSLLSQTETHPNSMSKMVKTESTVRMVKTELMAKMHMMLRLKTVIPALMKSGLPS